MLERISFVFVVLVVGCVSAKPIPLTDGRKGDVSEEVVESEDSGPDCESECLCDRVIGLCNTTAPGLEEECSCDLDCRFGAACAGDGYCDRDCRSDEDCDDPRGPSRENRYCDFDCIRNPECDSTCIWAPDRWPDCACDLSVGLCDGSNERSECVCDSDCDGVTCGSDGVCEEGCVSDSDCGGLACDHAGFGGACICDRAGGICDPSVDGTGDSCHCDPDC